jgi:hypothetical protein
VAERREEKKCGEAQPAAQVAGGGSALGGEAAERREEI